MLLDLFLL